MQNQTQTQCKSEPHNKLGTYYTSPKQYDGILLVSFGGPEGTEDVIPFLKNVTKGKNIPEERLQEVAVHYNHFGGISPINQQNIQLKLALEQRLKELNIDLPIFYGNRNWDPYIKDALLQAYENGCTNLIAITTSAYSCYSSCRQYREDLALALELTGLAQKVSIEKVRQFFNHPWFIDPFIESLRNSLANLLNPAANIPTPASPHSSPSANIIFNPQNTQNTAHKPKNIHILFTTHSIPVEDAIKSGTSVKINSTQNNQEGGAYQEQHLAVAKYIMDNIHSDTEERYSWELVYQSRSGPPSQPWLEPDIVDTIELLPERGITAVVVVPIGFISDHMEVLWDLDNEAKDAALEAGLSFVRTSTPGTHPSYINCLIDLICERQQGTQVEQRKYTTDINTPWVDVCGSGCCQNKRLQYKKALCGINP